MHSPPPAAGVAMDFGQNSLFGYMEDLQELTIIERPVRRSLKVRRTERCSPQGCPPDSALVAISPQPLRSFSPRRSQGPVPVPCPLTEASPLP